MLDLDDRIVQILLRPAVQKMSFVANKRLITGADYKAVVAKIQNGKIHCMSDGPTFKAARKRGENWGGMYSFDNKSSDPNTFIFERFFIDDDEEPAVVHEATHALLDNRNLGKSLPWYESEAVAYIAGAFFMRAIGLQNSLFDAIIYQIADGIVDLAMDDTKKLKVGAHYNVNDKAYGLLCTALKDNRDYQKAEGNLIVVSDGIP